MSNSYGRRLLCAVLQQEAESHPNWLLTIAAKTNDVADGFHYITYQRAVSAVNFLARWLQECFEGGSKPTLNPTLCYLGPPDARYTLIALAAIQCRYKVFLPSPRNTSAVNISMLEQTECTRLVHAPEVTPLVKGIQSAVGNLQCELISTLENLLSVPYTAYPYEFEFFQIYNEPIVVLHSSGSTGIPKLVTWTHGTVATVDNRDWPSIPGRKESGLSRLRFEKVQSCFYDLFPPFHMGGLLTKVMLPLWNSSIPIYGPALRPPSGALAAQVIRELRPVGVAFPPSVAEQLILQPDGETLYKSLDFAIFGGGPLSRQAGSRITNLTALIAAWGSTEAIGVHQLLTSPEDWEYIEFHPGEYVELQPTGEGLFELVFQISKGHERTQALYHNFPDLVEWRSRDLFEKHTTKPNLWKFHGRLDDIIVFSSGQKLYPLPMEGAMANLAEVKGALVVGKGYPQPALLVELSEDAKFKSDEEARQSLWPAVEAANAFLPGYGRVSQSMILIANPGKPLKRASKGTVIRRSSEELYAEEIDALYHYYTTFNGPHTADHVPSVLQIEDVKKMLRSVFQSVTLNSHLCDNENVYSQGMDSIKTAEALSHVKSSLRAHRPNLRLDWLSIEMFYTYPTLSQLAQVLVSFLNDNTVPAKQDQVALMEMMIEEYSQDLPKFLPNEQRRGSTKGLKIAVIGTTGFLGGHLLNALCQIPNISQIYCLNRSQLTGEATTSESSTYHDVELVYLQYVSGAPNLGLSAQNYSVLVDNCSLILHNGWTVDFNLPIAVFQDSLRNVRSLINLSASAPCRPRVVFISSIAATGGWASADPSQQVVPEGMVDDLSTTIETGYAQSKRIAEHVLWNASKQSGIPTTIVRVGHLIPNRGDRLSENDLLTVFLRTCKELGMIASEFLAYLDWLQVDVAAKIIGDIVRNELNNGNSTSMSVFNVVNTTDSTQTNLLIPIESWSGMTLKQINLKEWVEALKRQHGTDAAANMRLPALRMLSTFDRVDKRGPMHKYEQRTLRSVSSSMSELTAVDADTVESWLQNL